MNQVTSLSDLSLYAQGQVITLPPFAEDQPFVARLRRPSIMVLAKSGKIPNALLSAATELFTGKADKNDPMDIAEIMGVVEVICEASFIEPTFQQILESGLELTDEQYMAVFNYSQRGIKALEPFRKEPVQHKSPSGDGATVQPAGI